MVDIMLGQKKEKIDAKKKMNKLEKYKGKLLKFDCTDK